jgi:AP endonuclease-2
MKTTRSALDRPTAIPESYDSFFSFPITKGGYSGVATYTKSRNNVVPLKAEEGLSGILQPKPALSPDERISRNYPLAHEMELTPDELGNTPSDFVGLDSEGRALVLDFGLFVLINTYCPAESVEDRLSFKMNYILLLESRVRQLIKEGREVIVLGDINIASQPLDHGDGTLESTRKSFFDHPPRAWMKKWLEPHGPMIDAVRRFWPGREGMYTCL